MHYKLFWSVKELQKYWKEDFSGNLFLTPSYLYVLEKAAPKNMRCCFIGVFREEKLVGIALSQYIDLDSIATFDNDISCFKNKIRGFVFKKFSQHILVIGNNMLTGQNCFAFLEDINQEEGIAAIKKASKELQLIYKKKGVKIHMTLFKDFFKEEVKIFKSKKFSLFSKFSTQPNMLFEIKHNWKSIEDYVACLSKKYRDHYKRARKKKVGITDREMTLEEIGCFQIQMYKLYENVVKNAPFTTFYLPENHFYAIKASLKDAFIVTGYFMENILVGFSTVIKNHNDLDTYFLGYDALLQRDKMLYLNMLYDMIGIGITKKCTQIVFARTALEIKSSVGAKPVAMFGFMQHSNVLVNWMLPYLFRYFEPKISWQIRNPFKE